MHLLLIAPILLLVALFCARHPSAKILGLTVLFLSMLGTASAWTNVPEERIILQAPTGISFSGITKADGELKISIDMRYSDWSRAMSKTAIRPV